MSIKYLPSDELKRFAPKKLVDKLVSETLTLNKSVLSMLSRVPFLSKKKLETIAIRVLKKYKELFREELKDGASKAEALDAATNGNALMVQRVQNAIVFEISKEIKDVYRGERYRWLPSDAEVPDPLHQLNYGKRFTIGKGEMPGDRYGCRCGMEILVDETELDLEE